MVPIVKPHLLMMTIGLVAAVLSMIIRVAVPTVAGHAIDHALVRHVHLETHEFGGKRWDTIGVSACPPPLNEDILPLKIAQLTQTLLECMAFVPLEKQEKSQAVLLGCN